MNSESQNPIHYAMTGVSHALGSISSRDLDCIGAVYLFGSVSQGRSTKESDIDIFVDADLPPTRRNALRRTLVKAFDEFQLSAEGLRFKLVGISNRFSPIVGKLDEWKDLKRSIALGGIQLFGTPRLKISGGEPWFVYSWEKPPSKIRGAFLNAVYGYTVKKEHRPGLIEKSKGFKIGKSAIALPRVNSKRFLELVEGYKVPYTVREFFR